MNLENKSTEDLLKIARGDSLQSRSTEDLLKVAQGKPVEAGMDWSMGGIASKLGDAFMDTPILPLKDFRGNEIKVKDIPGIASNAAGEVGSLVKFMSDPMGSDFVKGLREMPGAIAKDPLGAAKAVGKGVLEDTVMGGIGAFKREPLQTLAVAGELPGVANKMMSALGRGTKVGGKATLSRMSGLPEELLSDVAGGRRRGKNSPQMDSFNEGLNKTTTEEFAAKVQKVVAEDLPNAASEKWDEAFQALKVPDSGISIGAARRDLADVLARQRISTGADGLDFSRSDFRARPDLQKKITQIVETLDTMDPTDVRDIHSALKSAYKIVDTLPIDDGASRRALSEIWGQYRDTVGKQIPGFNEMQKEFSVAQKTLEGFRAQLLGNAKQGRLQKMDSNGAISKNLIAALDHMWSPNANRSVQREFADKLSAEIRDVLGEKVDIKRVAGGLRVKSGSRSGFGTTLDVLLGGGGIMAGFHGDLGTMAGSMLAAIVSSATIQNPRFAASIAKTFGATEEVADEIARRVRMIKKGVEAKGLSVEGLSVAAGLSAIAGGSMAEDEQPTMTQLLSRAQQNRSRANQPAQ